MADAVGALGSWQKADTTVGQLLGALGDLRRDVPARTATRTAVLTLVAVASDAAECERAADALHRLRARHPARMIGMVSTSQQRPMSAKISLHGTEEAGRVLWSEDIELQVGGPVVRHLDSLIEPLTLPDLPVVVWFVDHVPEIPDPLVDAADAVIVDARDLGDAESFAAIRAMAAQVAVVDLSWFRLRPWRELLATLFEGGCRPFVGGVDTAAVRGKAGPRRLLSGWLADRLGLPRRSFHLAEAEHASMHLVAHAAGRRGEFSVERRGDERVVLATSAIEPQPPHVTSRPLPPGDPAWGLQEALTSLKGDPLYARALDAATALGT